MWPSEHVDADPASLLFMAAYVARYGSDSMSCWERRPMTELFDAYAALSEIVKLENGKGED